MSQESFEEKLQETSEKCLLSLQSSLDGIVDKGEVNALERNLAQLANNIMNKDGVPIDVALDRATEKMLDENERDLRIKKWHMQLNIMRRKEFFDFAKKFPFLTEALRARLSGIVRYREGARLSTDAITVDFQNQFATDLYLGLSRDDVWDDFNKNQVNDNDIANELIKEGSTNNPKAKKIASTVNKTYEKGRRILNRYGADIRELESFAANQVHNAELMISPTGNFIKDANLWRKNILKSGFRETRKLMKEMAYARWKSFIVPLLNKQKTFGLLGDDERESFMASAWDHITSGSKVKDLSEAGEEDAGKLRISTPGNRATRLGAARVFHFEDGTNWLKYNAQYGDGTLSRAVYGTLNKMGRNAGLLQHWGPNPRAFFDDIIKRIKADPEARADPKLKGQIHIAENIFGQLDGSLNIPTDALTAKIWSNFRAFLTITKLPLILFSSLSDVATRSAEMRNHGIGFLDRWGEIGNTFVSGKSAAERKAVGAMFRVQMASHMGSVVSRFSAFDSKAGTMSNALNLFFKYTGIDWWDLTNKQSHAISLGKYLAMERGKTFSKLHPLEQRLMNNYEIGQAEWDFYRENALAPHGNEKFIVPDMVQAASTESLDKYLVSVGKDVTDFNREDMQTILNQKLGAYFLDRVNHAIITPDAADRAIGIRGQQAGTFWGEQVRNLLQFKTFSIAFMRRTYGSALLGGNLAGSADVMGMMSLIATSTVMGYVSITMKNLIQGLQPRNPLDPQTWIASMLQGGGMGIYGDFLFGNYSRFGQSFTNTLMGPTYGTINDVVRLADALIRQDHPSDAALNILNHDVPVVNMWFFKTAFNYLFLYAIADWLDPGYVNRMIKNRQKNSNQKFIFDPSQYALGV